MSGCALLLAVGCSRKPMAPPTLHEIAGPTMGSSYVVKWHGEAGPKVVQPVVAAVLAEIDQAFSNWRPDSEIAACNAAAGAAPFHASALLRRGVQLGLDLAAMTDGAFDPTVLPLSNLFREQKRSHTAMAPAVLTAALARVDWRRLRVDGETVIKAQADVAIDLDGLAAGLAADRLAAALQGLGVRDFLLQITGEVLCRGVRPDGTPWQIGIVDPAAAEPGAERAGVTVPLADRALCTSGDYRNFTVVDGKVVTHVFDPRTGRNPEHGVVSASVLARSCALADGLGTALMVTGPAGAAAVLERSGDAEAAAWFVLADPDGTLRTEAVHWPEAFALDGRMLWPPGLDPGERAEREQALATAQLRSLAAPDDLDATIWLGRRLGYLGEIRAALATFTRGLERHPDEPHLLRHRGHRQLSVRAFAVARADLERALQVVQGQPDEVEPDGLPVPGRPPHSTLHGNIDYHLGIACFCLGDFAAAATAFGRLAERAGSDEVRVAAAHWLWCARSRLGDAAGAAAAVAGLGGERDVVENRGYLQLVRVYRGELDPATLAAGPDGDGAAIAFGLAHRALVQHAADATARLRAVALRPDWVSFGVLAAEAECARLPH